MHTEVPEIRDLILKNTKSLQMQGKSDDDDLMMKVVMMVMMMMMMMMMMIIMVDGDSTIESHTVTFTCYYYYNYRLPFW